ncbi:MAG: hypothetical protein ACK55Z_07430, partial [bacterium]
AAGLVARAPICLIFFLEDLIGALHRDALPGERVPQRNEGVAQDLRAPQLALLVNRKAQALVRKQHFVFQVHSRQLVPGHLLLGFITAHHLGLQQRLPGA